MQRLGSPDPSGLRQVQCHSLSRVDREMTQLETPVNRLSNVCLSQGAKRYRIRTRSETWVAVRANGRKPASKILAHLIIAMET